MDDEKLAAMRDNLPRIWINVYQGCLQAGFDEAQSFNLLQTLILSNNPNGTRPNDSNGPPNDTE